MSCNNKCYWNYNGLCVSDMLDEDFEGHVENDLDCKYLLREDFEVAFHELNLECLFLFGDLSWMLDRGKLNFKELESVRSLILKLKNNI